MADPHLRGLMLLRAALWGLAALPVLWAGLTSLPGRISPAEVVVYIVVLGAAVLLAERRPAPALAIAFAAWQVVFIGRMGTNSLLAAAALAGGLAVTGLLTGRSVASGHRDAAVLVLGPAAGAAAALVLTGEADGAISAALGAAVLSSVPWAIGRYRREHAAMVREGWDRAARWEKEAEYARSRERTRLAGEMHDLVGHELAKVALQIGALEVDSTLDERYRRAAGSARTGVTAAAERLADTVRMLRAESDDPGRTVSELVERSAAAGLDVALDAAELQPHDPVVAATLARVVAEALTNAMKHAPGTAVGVTVRDGDRGPVVAVENTPPRSSAHRRPAVGSGFGLAGLGERVRLLGGTFSAGPEPGGGFRITAELPRTPAAPTRPGSTATDVERHRAQERVRRSGRQAVLAAALVSTTGVSVVLAYMWLDAATSVISPADATRIRPGDPATAIAPLLPARTRVDDPAGVPAEPPGATCRYYSTHANPFVASGRALHRLCIRDDRVLGVDVVTRTDLPEAAD